tara:strand:- start:119 stop:385 length:267 start_codon:yes stop_codon:yes gene_type:complete
MPHSNESSFERIQEYIKNSFSNSYITQFIFPDLMTYEEKFREVQLTNAVRKGLEEHLKDVIKDNMLLKRQLDEKNNEIAILNYDLINS